MHRRHHPWDEFSRLTDWRLEWSDDLPGTRFGVTCFETRTVTLQKGIGQAERRCTIAHETQHILRGPPRPGRELAEELLIDRKVARLLMPSVRRVAHALAFHRADVELAAEELWVDESMLHVRLSALRPTEREFMEYQRATILVT